MDIVDLGIIDYKKALDVQIDLLKKRIDVKVPDTLIILEHEPVVTLGRIAGEEALLDPSYFEENKIPVLKTGRGGKNTYHAPGQLVLYPIVDLGAKRDISFYIDFLERTVSRSLAKLGISSEANLARRGVWASGKKIAFIGIAVKKWVAYHGVSININNGIEPFLHMHPCGESDIRVTSAKEVMGRELDMDEVKKIFAEQFAEDFSIAFSTKQMVFSGEN